MTLRTLVLFVIPLVLASIGVITVVVTLAEKALGSCRSGKTARRRIIP